MNIQYLTKTKFKLSTKTRIVGTIRASKRWKQTAVGQGTKDVCIRIYSTKIGEVQGSTVSRVYRKCVSKIAIWWLNLAEN